MNSSSSATSSQPVPHLTSTPSKSSRKRARSTSPSFTLRSSSPSGILPLATATKMEQAIRDLRAAEQDLDIIKIQREDKEKDLILSQKDYMGIKMKVRMLRERMDRLSVEEELETLQGKLKEEMDSAKHFEQRARELEDDNVTMRKAMTGLQDTYTTKMEEMERGRMQDMLDRDTKINEITNSLEENKKVEGDLRERNVKLEERLEELKELVHRPISIGSFKILTSTEEEGRKKWTDIGM
ncbi:uncharacterized protein L199_007045 [Kwoniella botswanensis]|uniref:uncharacterized protein n=1 Tax=Kwoniella botswanensis TaxID=1268659 RepID=UPI00315D4435